MRRVGRGRTIQACARSPSAECSRSVAPGAGVRTRADQADLFGTVSNLVLSFRAIVSEGDTYVIREFRRDDPDAAALLVHLGAAALLSVTMRVVPNSYVGRRVEYPDWEVAYAPTAQEGSLQALVEEHGLVQALWFPFTQTPVVQHFTEVFTQTLAHLPWLTPLVERRVLGEMRHLSPPDQEWHGTTGNMLLYVQHDTLRVVSLAYAVHVRSDQLQEAVHALAGQFDRMLHDYAAGGHDPINSCLEMRVTDVDRAEALGIPGAVPAMLSAGLPINGSERVIWFDLCPEWSKAWAVSPDGPWTDEVVLARARERIRPAVEIWDRLDDRGVYGSPLLDKLRQSAR